MREVTMIDEAAFAALAERVGEDAYSYGADRAQAVPILGPVDAGRILEGIDELMPSFLSGEWADDPTPLSIARDYGVHDDDALVDLCSHFEEQAAIGWSETLQARCIAVIGGEP